MLIMNNFLGQFPLSFKVSRMDDLARQRKIKAFFFQVLQEVGTFATYH